MNLKIDEEFRSLIPPLANEEREQLKQNIINDGAIREPIAVWHDFIIDGHNRYEIAQETGISFNTFSMDSKLEDRNDVMIWMIENQKGRRNLPQPERAKLAFKLKPMYEARAKKNQQVGADITNGKTLSAELHKADTLQQMADVAGISRRSMAKYQKLVESNNQEVINQYEEGEISLNAAYNKVMGIEEKPKPNKELEEANAKIRELQEQIENAGNNDELEAMRKAFIDQSKELKQAKETAETYRQSWNRERENASKAFEMAQKNVEQSPKYQKLLKENETFKAHIQGKSLEQHAQETNQPELRRSRKEETRIVEAIDSIAAALSKLPAKVEIPGWAEVYLREQEMLLSFTRETLERSIPNLQMLLDEFKGQTGIRRIK